MHKISQYIFKMMELPQLLLSLSPTKMAIID